MPLASGFESGVFWKAAQIAEQPTIATQSSPDNGRASGARSKSIGAIVRQREATRLQELGHCVVVAKSIAASLHLGGDELDRARVQRLKSQLLSITQAYAHDVYGSAELEKVSVVNARELLRRVCRVCRKRADPKRVTISLTSFLGVAAVQPMAFAKAISELVDNAVEASRGGQLVCISVFTTSNGDLLWQVRDDGVGMSPRLMHDLAEPQRATKHGRVGLGITVARIIVEEHRGLLHFESTPGVGTTATVWLPRRRALPGV